MLRYNSVGYEVYDCKPLRIRSRNTWEAEFAAFMIFAIAWLHSREPIAVRGPQIEGQTHANHHPRGMDTIILIESETWSAMTFVR